MVISPCSKMAPEEGHEELHQPINKYASDGVDDAFWASQGDGRKTKKGKLDRKPKNRIFEKRLHLALRRSNQPLTELASITGSPIVRSVPLSTSHADVVSFRCGCPN
jgi:hypothetical protein